MGAGSSFLRGGDDSGDNSSVGASPGNEDGYSGRHHQRGVTKRIPIEVKPRGRLGLRSVKSFGRPKLAGASGSLRSALSVEVEPNAEAERVRRDFDAYRQQREGESSRAQAHVHAFEVENRRLRAELRAMQTAGNKLREERDAALTAEQRAVVRAAAFESDRDKVQRQFKIFRETKESELQNLLKDRRKLEARLMKAGHPLLDDEAGSRQDVSLSGGTLGEWWTTLDSEPSLGSTTQLAPGASFRGPEFAHTLMEMEAPYFNISRDDWSAVTATLAQIYPTMHESLRTHTIHVYISASDDVGVEVDTLLQKMIPVLKQTCLSEGRFLVPTYMPRPDRDDADQHQRRRYLKARQKRIDSCSIFIAFIGKHIDSYVLSDVESACSQQPITRPTIICCRTDNGREASGGVVDLTRRLHANAGVKVAEYDDPEAGAGVARTELERSLKLDFGVESGGGKELEWMDSNSQYADADLFNSTAFWDADDENEQLEALLRATRSTCELGFDKYYEVLNGHVSAAGPVQPQLIAGPAGSGRSLLLAKWIEQLRQRTAGLLVLSHFVGSPTSSSANSTLMMRRLSAQLMQQIASPVTLHVDPGHLVAEFPKWLEKISSKVPAGVVLILDSVDRLQNVESADLQWLLDPLPVNSRVVLSVQEDMCPQAWRSWPTLHLEPLDQRRRADLVRAELASLDCGLTAPQEESLLTTVVNTPLYLVVLVSDVARCSERDMDERIASLTATSDTVELYQKVIGWLEVDHGQAGGISILCQVLKFIYASRNGLSETELFELIPQLTWNLWVPLEGALVDRHVLTYLSGRLVFAHEQLYLAIKEKYFSDENDDNVDATRRKLTEYFQKTMKADDVTHRVADELPWLCRQLRDKDLLQQSLVDMRLFYKLYSRGRCAELISYWQYLAIERSTMAQLYVVAIKNMEMMDGESNVFFTLAKMADIYEALGKFLCDLALLNEALMPLQRALELRETTLDPDHPRVAYGLHLLACLHARQAKFGVAEALYKQACEIYAGAYGADHCCVAREIQALCRLYHKQGKHQLAEPLHKRAISIRRKSRHHARVPSQAALLMEPLRRRVLQSSQLAVQSNSAEMARTLNEVAVLFYLQNNVETAESFFKRCLEMREALLGPHHPDVAQSLHNLAGLYNERRRYDRAEPLYCRALDIRRDHFPPDHANIGNVVKHLAMMYKKMGQFEKARPLYREMVESRERVFGGSHPAVATVVVNLAVLYSQEGNHAAALPLYERALKIYEDSFGCNHPRVAETLRNLALLKYDQGEYETAAKLYKRATEIKENEMSASKVSSPHGSSGDIFAHGKTTSWHGSGGDLCQPAAKAASAETQPDKTESPKSSSGATGSTLRNQTEQTEQAVC